MLQGYDKSTNNTKRPNIGSRDKEEVEKTVIKRNSNSDLDKGDITSDEKK
jgi:hypothetical protein